MQQIINFIIKNKSFLLFLLLFSISILFTIQSHSYHKSKFINSANFISGNIYNSTNNISEYFNLKTQNEILSIENNRLKSILYNSESQSNTTYLDSSFNNNSFIFTHAKVIHNSYSATNNILLINKGIRDSIKQDFGAITSKGILGIVDNVSHKYATVISILNANNKISAQLKKSNHFGTLTWNAISPEFTQLIDIPVIAPVSLGDTIVTSGRSTIFPKGIPIGLIEDFKLDNAENFYEINVRLFNDMTNIEHVYIIENRDALEISNLQNNTNE